MYCKFNDLECDDFSVVTGVGGSYGIPGRKLKMVIQKNTVSQVSTVAMLYVTRCAETTRK